MRMTLSKTVNRLIREKDLTHLAILLVIALGIGLYLIATTVVITKDGVWYIEEARKFLERATGRYQRASLRISVTHFCGP